MDSFKRRIIMEDWNRNDWQGRRKDQYEFSAKVGFYSLVVGALVILVGLFYKFF
jgi:hypothetical protein